MRKVIFALLFISSAAVAGPNECGQGVRAAYEAYLMTTYDAKQPDAQKQAAALDFRLSQQPFAADAGHAGKALAYITKRLKDSGLRAIDSDIVAIPATEYIQEVCRYAK